MAFSLRNGTKSGEQQSGSAIAALDPTTPHPKKKK